MEKIQEIAVFDVETAQGFNAKSIHMCEIAIAILHKNEKRRWEIKESHDFYIQPPGNKYEKGISKIHKIEPEDTKDSPFFEEIWENRLKDLFKNRFLVAHNADFDTGVLENELKVAGMPIPLLPYSCTVDLARKAWPVLENHKLNNLAVQNSIKLVHHNAASDTNATAELLMIMFNNNKDVDGVKELSEKWNVPLGTLGKPPRWEGDLQPWQRTPHFEKDTDTSRWIIAAPIKYMVQGEIVEMHKKNGETSWSKLTGEIEVEENDYGVVIGKCFKHHQVRKPIDA